MNSLGLLELSEPVSFDPVGPVTSVFFDTKNQQVFSVRSGGATGIVVKTPKKQQKTFVLEDKGPVLSIKLSTNQKVLSVQRKKNGLDFHNIDGAGQVDPQEYSLSAKNKGSGILGYIWTGMEELATISEVGIDIYSILPAKKMVKYIRSSNTSVSWFVSCPSSSCPSSNIIVTASKTETNSLQVWSISSSNIFKLPGIDLCGSVVTEKDVSLLTVYEQTFIRVNLVMEGVLRGVQLYSAGQDQVTLTHQLAVSLTGLIAVQTLDNLILVHSLQDSSTQIFDIACSRFTQTQLASKPLEHEPILPETSLTEKGSCVPLEYAPSWVIFLPNILVDARHGDMWSLGLRLRRAECSDPVDLCLFHLHRAGGKPHLLDHLKQALRDPSVSLSKYSLMFGEIMKSYHQHMHPGELTILQTVGRSGLAWVQPAVVLDQSDIFTAVLAPAEKEGVGLVRLQGVLVELLLVLTSLKLPARQFILEMFINLAVKTEQYYQMHQYIQYGVVTDSKHLACILLSLESVYPPARQIALDMMSRLGNSVEELIEICLSEGKVVQAINLARDCGFGDTMCARKYLEAAKDQDTLAFFNVFSYFEERNLRLRGSARFQSEEKCERFVNRFKELFLLQAEVPQTTTGGS